MTAAEQHDARRAIDHQAAEMRAALHLVPAGAAREAALELLRQAVERALAGVAAPSPTP